MWAKVVAEERTTQLAKRGRVRKDAKVMDVHSAIEVCFIGSSRYAFRRVDHPASDWGLHEWSIVDMHMFDDAFDTANMFALRFFVLYSSA